MPHSITQVIWLNRETRKKVVSVHHPLLKVCCGDDDDDGDDNGDDDGDSGDDVDVVVAMVVMGIRMISWAHHVLHFWPIYFSQQP